MKGYEARIRVCVLKDFNSKYVYSKLAEFINFSMNKDDVLKKMHRGNGFKGYCFSGLSPFESTTYTEGDVYDFYIRSFDKGLLERFINVFRNLENEFMMTIDTEFIERSHECLIDSIFTTTPAVVTIRDDKSNDSPWIVGVENELLENAIVNNLVKKFNSVNGTNLYVDKNDIIERVDVCNKYPVKIPYKNISFLGNILEIKFKDNPIAQNLANTAYFLGVCTRNSSLGCGFTKANYRKR